MVYVASKPILNNSIFRQTARDYFKELALAQRDLDLDNDIRILFRHMPSLASVVFPMVYEGKDENSNVFAGFRKDKITPYADHYLNVGLNALKFHIYCPVVQTVSILHDALEDPQKLMNKLKEEGLESELTDEYVDGEDYLNRYLLNGRLKRIISRTNLEGELDKYCYSRGFGNGFVSTVRKGVLLETPTEKGWRHDLSFLDSGSDIYEKNDPLRMGIYVSKCLDSIDVLKDVETILFGLEHKELVKKLGDKINKVKYLQQFSNEAIEFYADGYLYSPQRSLVQNGLNNTLEFLEHLYLSVKPHCDDLNDDLLKRLSKNVRMAHPYYRQISLRNMV